MKAIWNDEVIAQSDETIIVEGNYYFPAKSIRSEFFKTTQTQSYCPNKGEANYYDLNVNGKINKDAAWTYLVPSDEFKEIQGFIAFWNGVKIVETVKNG